MGNNRFLSKITLASVLAAAMPLFGATFGNVVTTVGGHPADIALDESRSQLYIANFTALEIDVMSTQSKSIIKSIPLPSHPSGVALSADSTYLVVTEYQNGTSVPQGFDGVTIINLTTNAQQNFSTGDAALGVAFVRTGQAVGATSGQALIATAAAFYLLDPASGSLQVVATVANLAQMQPNPQATFPAQITEMQMSASANGLWIWGVADAGTGTQLIFRYNASTTAFSAQTWVTSPVLLPRVSTAADGSWALIGWAVYEPSQCGTGFVISSRFPNATTSINVTGHAANNSGGATTTIYGQIYDATQPTGPPYYTAASTLYPTLSIMDSDNFTVRDKLNLPEDLVGRAVLDSAGNNMYAISDSGVTVLPVGLLNKYPRLAASQEDLLVQTNYCNTTALTATFQVTDPGNNATDFQISTSQTGVIVSPASGKTPATVTVSVQPGAIPNPGGTLAVPLTITSLTAVNAAQTVRLLISNPDQDQRGTIVDIPGTLVDILPDTYRNRFYVLRQDKNQVLVFDGSSYQQLTTLRTGPSPSGISLTNDAKYLMVASKNSQLIQVYDLDSFQVQLPIQLPNSHYGASVAQSNVGTFALIENDGTGDCPLGGTSYSATGSACAIDRLDLTTRCAYSPPALGIWANSNGNLPATTVLSPSPDQASILVAAPNGNVMLYDATHDTFILSRKDLSALSGAYAVSPTGATSTSGPSFPSEYVVGDNVFDASLVPQGTLDTSVGTTLGFTFTGSGSGYRVTGTTSAAAGAIQNLPNVQQATNVKAVRTVEAPAMSSTAQPFTRTIAPLANSIILLTTSGATVLAPNYDAAVTSPSISAVTSAADGSQNVAPGGLISVWGQQMSPVNMATSQIPLPTALAGSCLSVNGVPVPLLFVSGTQVNAQLPYTVSGAASMTVHTPGGVSDSFSFEVSPTAPTVFLSGSAGPVSGIATVILAENSQLVTPTNPVHPKDTLVIYLTGMGTTSPQVSAGLPGPATPLAAVVSSPNVTLGGYGLQVQYAGLAPGEVGVYQINAYIPLGVPAGLSVPLVISQGGTSTTLNLRVVD